MPISEGYVYHARRTREAGPSFAPSPGQAKPGEESPVSFLRKQESKGLGRIASWIPTFVGMTYKGYCHCRESGSPESIPQFPLAQQEHRSRHKAAWTAACAGMTHCSPPFDSNVAIPGKCSKTSYFFRKEIRYDERNPWRDLLVRSEALGKVCLGDTVFTGTTSVPLHKGPLDFLLRDVSSVFNPFPLSSVFPISWQTCRYQCTAGEAGIGPDQQVPPVELHSSKMLQNLILFPKGDPL